MDGCPTHRGGRRYYDASMALSLHRLGALGAGSAVLACVVLAGCAPGASFDSPDSTARLKAIRNAAAERDRSAIPNLIEMLESDDPAVRVMAIGVLKDMTGEDMGYDPYGESMDRRRAIERWEAWHARGGTGGADANGIQTMGESAVPDQSPAPASRSKGEQSRGGGGGGAA